MNRTQIAAFHAVAKHGGFSAASRAIHTSQPALSAQVKALEEHYGIELFHRKGRQTVLSLAGRELYNITSRQERLEEEIEDLLSSLKELRAGNLNIAAVGPFHATDMIAAFKAAYPNVSVSVQLGNSRRSLERVVELEADVGLIAEVHPDPRVETLLYSEHEVVVFVNDEHPFYQRDSISIRELKRQPVIWREEGSTTRRAAEAALERFRVAVDTVLEIGSREGVWKAVERGMGIGFVADFEFVSHPRLKALRIKDADIHTRYYVAFLKDRSQSRLIRSFLKTAL